MTNLLTRLAALAHLTPDEIQSRISPTRWIRFGDLTDQDFERLANKKMVLAKRQGRAGTLVISRPRHHHWRFWGHTSPGDRTYFLTILRNHWGILAEDYIDGDLPDPALVAARASDPG